jgi:ketosteroid isomerase-like protein
METQTRARPLAIVERIVTAQNAGDVDAMVACFAPDYQSTQPLHPARAFTGNEQVRKNWTALLGGMPDFNAELLRSAVSGDTVWAEFRWTATKPDGSPFEEAIVIIFGTRDDKVAWARLYGDEVEREGADINSSVQAITGTQLRRP